MCPSSSTAIRRTGCARLEAPSTASRRPCRNSPRRSWTWRARNEEGRDSYEMRAKSPNLTLQTGVRRCSRAAFLLALKPSPALEEIIGQNCRGDHQPNSPKIAERPLEFRHVFEVHAVDRRDKRRWQEDDGRDGEDLDDLVLLQVDEAERGVEQKIDLAREKRRLVGERNHIPVKHPGAGAGFLDPLLVISIECRVIGQDAIDAYEAFTHLGQKITVAADLLNNRL